MQNSCYKIQSTLEETKAKTRTYTHIHSYSTLERGAVAVAISDQLNANKQANGHNDNNGAAFIGNDEINFK